MNNPLVLLMTMLAAPASAQPALALCANGHPTPTFSIGGACQRPDMAVLSGMPVGGAAVDPGRSAWVIGANYTVATEDVPFGYARQYAHLRLSARQWSIGYATPLSTRTRVFAHASGKKAERTLGQFDIGIKAAF